VTVAASDEQQPTFPNTMSRGRRAADFLGLERNVVVVSAVVFLLGFGEELWKKFLPKYLEALPPSSVSHSSPSRSCLPRGSPY